MKKKIIIVLIAIAIIAGEIYYNIKTKHTFTLTGSDQNGLKSEMIVPIFNKVLVSTSKDSKVTFIDMNDKDDIRTIEYLSANVIESIDLEKGNTYYVISEADVTIIGIDVCIE